MGTPDPCSVPVIVVVVYERGGVFYDSVHYALPR